MNLTNLAKHYSDAGAAREFLEKLRWPDGVECPFCGLVGEAYKLAPKENSKKPVRPGVWKCAGCRKQFTVTVGTIFEDSPHLSKRVAYGVSFDLRQQERHERPSVTPYVRHWIQKSAWFMAHRIRYVIAQEPLSGLLAGTVEIDETYIGGKRRAGSQAVKIGERAKDRPSPYDKKAPVVSLVQRGG